MRPKSSQNKYILGSRKPSKPLKKIKETYFVSELVLVIQIDSCSNTYFGQLFEFVTIYPPLFQVRGK